MGPIQIKCKLIGISERKDGNTRTIITLLELENQKTHEILVDESCTRVRARLMEQFNGDTRDGIFLSRMMTNIDIDTKGVTWSINQEDWIWYIFPRTDILNLQPGVSIL